MGDFEKWQETLHTLGAFIRNPVEAARIIKQGWDDGQEEQKVGIHDEAELKQRIEALETAVTEFIRVRNAGSSSSKKEVVEQLISLGKAIRGLPPAYKSALPESINKDIIGRALSISRSAERIRDASRAVSYTIEDLEQRHPDWLNLKGGKSRRRKSRKRKSRKRKSRRRTNRK